MKVTRSYWLGLGSGLILSAMLTLIFSPQQRISDVQSDVNPQVKNPLSEETKKSDSSLLVQSSKQSLLSEAQTPIKVDLDFFIPKGATAEQIGDLLFAQGFIKNKITFLERTHQMGAERQFRAGTFSLVFGLTEEELIHRLLK